MSGRKFISGIFTRLAIERNPAVDFFKTNNGKAWLNNALVFAKSTSIASVKNLRSKPKYWFILVDSTLCPEQKKRALNAFSTNTSIETRLIEVDGWSESSSAIENDKYATMCDVQVRLDYDDLLHRDYFDEIYRVIVTCKAPCLVSPVRGISHNIYPTQIAIIHKKLPPFSSLYRPTQTTQLTIFSYDHDKWPHEMVVELAVKPLWIQTISGKNISNTFGHGWLVSKVRHVRSLNLKEWKGETAALSTTDQHLALKNFLEISREKIGSLCDLFPLRNKNSERL